MEAKLETKTIEEAVNARATDVHIDPMMAGYSIRFRIDGELRLWKKTGYETGIRLINQIKADVGIEPGTVFSSGWRTTKDGCEREADRSPSDPRPVH